MHSTFATTEKYCTLARASLHLYSLACPRGGARLGVLDLLILLRITTGVSMESQFRQPKQVINTEVNKKSIAHVFLT